MILRSAAGFAHASGYPRITIPGELGDNGMAV